MDINPLLRNRFSPVLFKEKAVEPEKINALIEAARWAPSCSNNQPWKFVMVRMDDGSRPALEEALSRGNAWAMKAPLLVIVAADPKDDCDSNGVAYHAYDAGLAAMSMVIEAENRGLRAHQMAGWDPAKLCSAVGLPESVQPIALIAIGYEESKDKVWDHLDDRMKEKAERVLKRERKPREICFFLGSFGKNVKTKNNSD